MSNAIKLVNQEVELAQQLEMLKAQQEALKAQQAEVKAKVKALTAKVSCKKITTQKTQKTGFTVNGVGAPLWFYKEHALALFSDEPKAVENRKIIMEFIAANPDLTEKS